MERQQVCTFGISKFILLIAMKELKEMLEDKGFKVFCVPEVPTMVIFFQFLNNFR